MTQYVRKISSHWIPVLFTLLLTAGVIRLFRAAEIDSQDFRVYWKATHLWFQGSFPYQILASDQGFVFKYPPWMLPLFSPLGWLGFDFSKAIWACLELGAIVYSFFWLIQNGISRRVALGVVALFWYIWLAHLYAGQVTLFLLVAALWAMTPSHTPSTKAFKNFCVGFLFTAKVFSTYSLVGIWRKLLQPRVILYGVLAFVVSNGLLLLKIHSTGQPLASTWIHLYQGWVQAAGSGSAELGAEVVRGTGNHGFTAAILRWMDPHAQSLHLDLMVSLSLALGLGFLWSLSIRSCRFALSPLQQWAGWLAFGVIVHPLAWHHSFVLAFPLCAFSLEASLQTRKRSLISLSLLGICLIGILVPQVVGKTLVRPFELLSNKSWGVVACAVALLLASQGETSDENN